MTKKYELVQDDTVKTLDGRTLFRIRALVAIGQHVAAGDLGGYVESEKNLAQVFGNAWVYGDAWVYGNARVYGDAWVNGNAQVYGNARVSPLNLSGLRWTVTIADREMVIGCQAHEIDRWWKFTDAQIAKMDQHALEFWNTHKATLQALCTATGRPFAKVETPAEEAA